MSVNGKVRILIVEDNMPLAMLMVYLLAQAGCDTEAALTGRKALQMVREQDFDLITLNLDLPDIGGYEIYRRFKQNSCFHTPVVFVSGHCLLEDQQRGLDAGAADYITKPFENEEFVPRILSHVLQTAEREQRNLASGAQILSV